jgi:hypothetical protein
MERGESGRRVSRTRAALPHAKNVADGVAERGYPQVALGIRGRSTDQSTGPAVIPATAITPSASRRKGSTHRCRRADIECRPSGHEKQSVVGDPVDDRARHHLDARYGRSIGLTERESWPTLVDGIGVQHDRRTNQIVSHAGAAGRPPRANPLKHPPTSDAPDFSVFLRSSRWNADGRAAASDRSAHWPPSGPDIRGGGLRSCGGRRGGRIRLDRRLLHRLLALHGAAGGPDVLVRVTFRIRQSPVGVLAGAARGDLVRK